MVSRNLNVSTAVTVLFMMVSGGESRGVDPEVHDYLHSFDRVKLQVVKTAPDSQLLNFLSVSRLVTVLGEADQCGVICKLQDLDRGVFRSVVVRVEREEQWGDNTALRSFLCWSYRCWMCIFPASLAAACLSGSCWSTDRRRCGRRAVSVWRDDGVKSGAEVHKQDPHISPWSVQMLQD